MDSLTSEQTAVLEADKSSFLLGPAGTGKSSALRLKLKQLLQRGELAYTILVLVAEPDHRQRFLDTIQQEGVGPHTELQILSYNELARDMVTLFWPLIARPAGFQKPYQPPAILTYDLAQLLMWQIITPMIDQGAFAAIRLRPQQIVSQILDTLNRAALNNLTLEEAVTRHIAAWPGEKERRVHLNEAAEAARRFRTHCFDNSLLDLSLIIEVFNTQLVNHPQFQTYFIERYRHLFVDNIEEQTPAGQRFIETLVTQMQTAVLVYDSGGGYKRFLAADPTRASRFHKLCNDIIKFESTTFLSHPNLFYLANLVENQLQQTTFPIADPDLELAAENSILALIGGRYRREMVRNLIPAIAEQIENGVAPKEIAIIAPYLDGALRYMLQQNLAKAGIPYQILRRRSSPREEPRIRAWLTWLALAFPEWNIHPAPFDVAEASTFTFKGIDPARAALLTEHLYHVESGILQPAASLSAAVTERLGSKTLNRYETLRLWLIEQDEQNGLDHFLHALFNELLNHQPFQPQTDLTAAAICDWLVRSAARLRQTAPALQLHTPKAVGRAFISTIYQGLVTADQPNLGDPPDPDGVQIATIYGYLLTGAPARVQVWLETAATGWWDIPRQPLSNAFVLTPSWPQDKMWQAEDDLKIRDHLLSRIIRGLTARCQDGIILASSDLDRRGMRQDGRLWRALEPLLSRENDALLS